MRVKLAKEKERTVIFGVVANGHRFWRASGRRQHGWKHGQHSEKDKEVIGNMQCRRLNEERLILPSWIPAAHWKETNKRVVRHYQEVDPR